ncbi:MAG: hypothetical protein SF123_12170 [Chloroflexota bacterium]|nr:hypothetical protein [Chloroflexota bacterium]
MLRMRLFLLCLFTSVCLCLPVAAQAAGLTVDANSVLGDISPYTLGINYGPWSLVSPEMLPLAAQSGVTHVRFPAGRWGDVNNVTEQQLDLYMLQVRSWNAAPSVSVRLEGGTPEAAAALVRYANIERDYNVRDWSIGNEPDLYENYSIEQFNAEWRAIALAMRAVDPTIRLIGPEVSQFPATAAATPYLNERREWVRQFLEANGDLVDVVSVHRYPFPRVNGVATTLEQLRADAAEWDMLVENLRAVIRETLGRDLPIALTEVNSHWNPVTGGAATPDSFFQAIWWADVLGRLMRQQVEIVNYFMISSHGNLGGFGILDRYAVRPTYYVYQLYRQLGTQLLASSSSAEYVTITAARREDGALTLMVVNRGDDEARLPLHISDAGMPSPAEVWRLDADHNAERSGTLTLADGDLVVLPAQSVTLYIIADAAE